MYVNILQETWKSSFDLVIGNKPVYWVHSYRSSLLMTFLWVTVDNGSEMIRCPYLNLDNEI